MFLTVKRLMALSFATQREQFEQRTKPTWPRPFLLRPPFLLFLVCQEMVESKSLSLSEGNDANPPHLRGETDSRPKTPIV